MDKNEYVFLFEGKKRLCNLTSHWLNYLSMISIFSNCLSNWKCLQRKFNTWRFGNIHFSLKKSVCCDLNPGTTKWWRWYFLWPFWCSIRFSRAINQISSFNIIHFWFYCCLIQNPNQIPRRCRLRILRISLKFSIFNARPSAVPNR